MTSNNKLSPKMGMKLVKSSQGVEKMNKLQTSPFWDCSEGLVEGVFHFKAKNTHLMRVCLWYLI